MFLYKKENRESTVNKISQIDNVKVCNFENYTILHLVDGPFPSFNYVDFFDL